MGAYGYGRNYDSESLMPLPEEASVLTIINAVDAPCLPSRAATFGIKTEWSAMEERRQTVSGRELQEILTQPFLHLHQTKYTFKF